VTYSVRKGKLQKRKPRSEFHDCPIVDVSNLDGSPCDPDEVSTCSMQVSVAAGLGANVLVGISNRTVCYSRCRCKAKPASTLPVV
jgi:hypothetical protein